MISGGNNTKEETIEKAGTYNESRSCNSDKN